MEQQGTIAAMQLNQTAQLIEIDELQSLIREMNATVTEQQQLIGHQQVVIEELNETNVEQQEEIDKLKATVGVLNGSLVQLTSAVEQLLQATTFVPVGETTVGSLETTIGDRLQRRLMNRLLDWTFAPAIDVMTVGGCVGVGSRDGDCC